MQITASNNINSAFKGTEKNNKNMKIGFALGAMALPILPILDGDSFKDTFKNRSALKLAAGIAGIGGLFGLTSVLLSECKDDNVKLGAKTVLGAIIAPLFLLVDRWAQSEKKQISKKWYALASLGGAGLVYISQKINNK